MNYSRIGLPNVLVCVSVAGMGWAAPSARADLDRRSAIVEAVAKTRSAIVNLRTLRIIPARFENVESGRVRGLGTGVVIDPRGYLVTNYHVVEDVNEIEARTSTGARFAAAVVAIDKRADLAVLKIDAGRPLEFLSLDGAGGPILGETVIAVGNPYGLEESVTIGIISAVDRELKLPNGEMFSGLIQTDASINPGNSGGPIISVNGDLLGVTVAIRSNAQGIAFAIPAARVREILSAMMSGAGGLAQHGLDVEESVVVQAGGAAGVSGGSPLRLRSVEADSAAERAGLRAGDELVAVGGQPIRLRFDLDRVFWDRRKGETVPIVVRRDGEPISLEMSIGGGASDDDLVWEQLGIEARPVFEPVRRVQPKWEGGLWIQRVRSGSAADRAGFRPGDILCGLDGSMMLQTGHIRYVLRLEDLAGRQPVRYHLIRDGRVVEGRIRLPQ